MSRITVFEDGVLKLDSGAVVATPSPAPPPAPAPTPPATPPVPGNANPCPPPPQGMVTGVLDPQGGVVKSRLTSGQVVSYPLPLLTPVGFCTLVLNAMETTATTPNSLIELCISKCQGVIDPNGPVNSYGKSTATNWTPIQWAFKLGSQFQNVKQLTDRGYAWAPTTEGPWYVNIRVTYPTPPVPYWGNYDERGVQWGVGGY